MEMTEKLPPWYRQFWPWFLMLFPAAAVVGGIITFRVAVTSDDGVVEDDYYKQGLAINRTLARDQVAASAGLSAQVRVMDGQASVQLSGRLTEWPHQLRLRILHPTRAGMDQIVMLTSQGGGRYTGACTQPTMGKWDILLEDGQKNWRLVGHFTGRDEQTKLTPVR